MLDTGKTLTLMWSGKWDFVLDQAKTMIGGMIFLHNSKAEHSYFGGKVFEVRPTDYNGSKRVEFKFQPMDEAKRVPWKGDMTQRAWHSGFLTDGTAKKLHLLCRNYRLVRLIKDSPEDSPKDSPKDSPEDFPKNSAKKIHIDIQTYRRLCEEKEKGSFRTFNDTLRNIFEMPYSIAAKETAEIQKQVKAGGQNQNIKNEKIVVKYAHSRLCFLRDKIEPLEDDDCFQVETANHGTFVFPKKDFDTDFAKQKNSASYKDGGIYHYPKPPSKALRFRIK